MIVIPIHSIEKNRNCNHNSSNSRRCKQTLKSLLISEAGDIRLDSGRGEAQQPGGRFATQAEGVEPSVPVAPDPAPSRTSREQKHLQTQSPEHQIQKRRQAKH